MRKIWMLFVMLLGCSHQEYDTRESISLAGSWGFRTDTSDCGIAESWYSDTPDQSIRLPGSMAENGFGERITLSTPWTGSIVDSAYFSEPRYARYRNPDDLKIPFWLKPVTYYAGPAWYYKEVEIPAQWQEKRVILHLERCHWETNLFVNGQEAGSRNSLSTPHQYDITPWIHPGINKIVLRTDNRMIKPVGINSHSVSDQTQGNWNGVIGHMFIETRHPIYLHHMALFPDVGSGRVKNIITLRNHATMPFSGTLELQARLVHPGDAPPLPMLIVPVALPSGEPADGSLQQMEVIYEMGDNVQTWSEFHPSLYRMDLVLKDKDGTPVDNEQVEFGMREFRTAGTRFTVNGLPVFLRGTLECCIFPKTGYPPADRSSWEKLLTQCRDHGLNHLRFHSWCPPSAAFEAADRLGFYLQVECGSWANQGSTIGDGTPLDSFIYSESKRIVEAYGNHPSFCMMAYGNEPAGRGANRFLEEFMAYWRARDDRRVYTAGAGWPLLPSNDYHNGPQPRIQQWGAGLESIINRDAPQTMFDYREVISQYQIPFVSHEIGQWCAYPDFKEIEQYDGVMRATNFEIFRETLEENHMGHQAEDFLMASGKLQALCYKAEIEAALRTPGLAGFQLLQLHDFPGQGTALVGILNAFFQSKGYISPEEFRCFCNQTVPLARMEKRVFLHSEEFSAEIELYHFGEEPLSQPHIVCRINDESGRELYRSDFRRDEIQRGNALDIGRISTGLIDWPAPAKYTLSVSIEGTPFANQWDFWMYPDQVDTDPGEIHVTDTLDQTTLHMLSEGRSVLLLTHGKVGNNHGARVAIGFSSIFWNTAFTGGQAPHTLGILCDPSHPVFSRFPTEYHSNWQWWDPVSHSQAMILDHLPSDVSPLIQPIDTWFENRRLGLAFEGKVNGGKLLVCSIDLDGGLADRPVSRQLFHSILAYMNSADFDPRVILDPGMIEELWR